MSSSGWIHTATCLLRQIPGTGQGERKRQTSTNKKILFHNPHSQWVAGELNKDIIRQLFALKFNFTTSSLIFWWIKWGWVEQTRKGCDGFRGVVAVTTGSLCAIQSCAIPQHQQQIFAHLVEYQELRKDTFCGSDRFMGVLLWLAFDTVAKVKCLSKGGKRYNKIAQLSRNSQRTDADPSDSIKI